MPPPLKLKHGWENEALAGYILSRFSFIAHPSTISDDIGVDYFCTLFKVRMSGKDEYAEPRNSFAIQIKSNKRKINVSNKINYLKEIEIPYLVGVLDPQELSLTIYSGEYLPMFFTLKGDTIMGLTLKLCERQSLDYDSRDFYYKDLGNDMYELYLPRICEISAKANCTELDKVTDILNNYCSKMQRILHQKSVVNMFTNSWTRRKMYLFKFRPAPVHTGTFGRTSINDWLKFFITFIGYMIMKIG